MQHPPFPKVDASVTVIMLFVVCAFFARSWFQLLLHDAGYESHLASNLSFFVTLPVVAVLMWPILRDNKVAMRQWLRPPESWWLLIAYSVLFGFLLRVFYWAYRTAGAGFGWFYDENFPIVAAPQFKFSCPESPLLALSILTMVIMTPVFEELIHRGFILHALLPRGNALAIILSAILFGCLHRPDSMFMAFLTGLPLAVLGISLRALWGPIFVHATYNLADIFDWTCLQPMWNPAGNTPQLKLVGGASLLIMLCCLALVYWLLGIAKTGALLAPRSRPSNSG